MEVSISVKEAREKFSQLLDRAEHGEEVLITRRGKEVAKITAVDSTQSRDELIKRRAALRAALPALEQPSSDLIDSLREDRV